MQYKGFVATYYYAANLGIYVAEIVDHPHHICFAAKDFEALREVMRDALDNYLNAE